MSEFPAQAERTLILAPRGRDAVVAKGILREARIHAEICVDLPELVEEIRRGAGVAVITEEAVRTVDARELVAWVGSQPPWSDFPFIVLTEHGGGLERNPAASRLMETLGNVSFLERPFHPTTLVSVVQNNLRGRGRQYECRRLNEELESRVQERTAELAAANRQLLAQIEERERVETTLRQMQRLEAVGQLTSGVAHDFNNLLTVVLGNIGFLEKGLAAAQIDGKLSQRLGYMRTAAERGAKLTDQLLSFSRRQRLEPKVLDLNETVAGMRDLLQSTMGGSIRIDTKLTPGLWPALVDPTQIELAVLNLAINARDAMPSGGTIVIAAREEGGSSPVDRRVCLSIADNGEGMDKETLDRAIEPFFTTKGVGKGTGLGLSMVKGLVEESNGRLVLQSKKGQGTTVELWLPVAPTSVEPLRTTGDAPDVAAPTRPLSVLAVDDDSLVLMNVEAMLEELGHKVHTASSGAEAMEVLHRGAQVDLIVSDQIMPHMTGIQLAELVRETWPDTAFVIATGYAELPAEVGNIVRLTKPYMESDLRRAIATAIEGR